MLSETTNITRKNMLDLKYNKFLQYTNTAIIILFTYIVGICIAFLTNQINYKNPDQILWMEFISIAVISSTIHIILQFKENMNKIINEITHLGI